MKFLCPINLRSESIHFSILQASGVPSDSLSYDGSGCQLESPRKSRDIQLIQPKIIRPTFAIKVFKIHASPSSHPPHLQVPSAPPQKYPSIIKTPLYILSSSYDRYDKSTILSSNGCTSGTLYTPRAEKKLNLQKKQQLTNETVCSY